jgi:mRNA interferase RelE/StbE
MAWSIEFDPDARRELEKLDKPVSDRILKFLRERIAPLDDPRSIGERLQGPLRQYWKYRVGDYRLICSLKEDRLAVIVVRLGHRREIYNR